MAKFSLTSFYNKTKGSFPFSRDLLYRYYQHLLDSKTVFAARKFSDSEYKKARNPAKVYIIDSSLSQRIAHDDSARLLENTIFIELLRRNYKPHYFSNAYECDFAAVREDKTDLFQVTYQLEKGNREREISGIAKAAKHIRANTGYIFTYNQEDEFVSEDINIKVIPAWKWLLVKNLGLGDWGQSKIIEKIFLHALKHTALCFPNHLHIYRHRPRAFGVVDWCPG